MKRTEPFCGRDAALRRPRAAQSGAEKVAAWTFGCRGFDVRSWRERVCVFVPPAERGRGHRARCPYRIFWTHFEAQSFSNQRFRYENEQRICAPTDAQQIAMGGHSADCFGDEYHGDRAES